MFVIACNIFRVVVWIGVGVLRYICKYRSTTLVNAKLLLYFGQHAIMFIGMFVYDATEKGMYATKKSTLFVKLPTQ